MTLAIVFSAASLILWGFSFVFFLSYLKRRTGQERILAEFREEVDLIITDINDVTDRNVVLIEDRIKSLRSLLEKTDRRINTLGRELDRRSVREIAYARLGRNLVRETGTGPDAAPQALDAVPRDPAAASQAPAPDATPQAPAPDATPREPGDAGVPEGRDGGGPEGRLEPRHQSFTEQVAELYRAGLSADSIAARLDAPMAKVNLAIAMAERKWRQHSL
ncbi:MAG: hypothetical protein LBQ38_00745 [Spirochaetaceae bacterium]|jgi:hypothetical protein|nr:hypothetical protein [Spirochaetaceae bacterium]